MLNKKGGADPFPRGMEGSRFALKLAEIVAESPAEEKVLRRLAQMRPDLLELVEPGPADFGFVLPYPGCGEFDAPSGNRYHITDITPATLSTCPMRPFWSDDVKWFEKECERGNFRKVYLTYNKEGKMIVGGSAPLTRPAPQPIPKEMPKAPPQAAMLAPAPKEGKKEEKKEEKKPSLMDRLKTQKSTKKTGGV